MTLAQLNQEDPAGVRAALLQCCGSRRWVDGMIGMDKVDSLASLLSAAERIWWDLEPADWLEAFAAHPRIGEKKLTAWCSQEQKGVMAEPAETLQALAAGNRLYEQRFGWIFLIDASGKSGSQILTHLHARLTNDKHEELRIAAREQSRITALRLTRLIPE